MLKKDRDSNLGTKKKGETKINKSAHRDVYTKKNCDSHKKIKKRKIKKIKKNLFNTVDIKQKGKRTASRVIFFVFLPFFSHFPNTMFPHNLLTLVPW